jgi:hypothetical protein
MVTMSVFVELAAVIGFPQLGPESEESIHQLYRLLVWHHWWQGNDHFYGAQLL